MQEEITLPRILFAISLIAIIVGIFMVAESTGWAFIISGATAIGAIATYYFFTEVC
jgi:hypothetical protein